MVEMKVSRVEDDIMHFKCKGCGNEDEIEVSKLEHKESE